MADGADLRVAVVGSGPAGLYATEALVRGGAAGVDVFDRLPCPFGLVRYGVAPDHPKIRSIQGTLARVLQQPTVRFFGNVDVGRDVSVAELHHYYDAVVFAYGAAVDRRLNIPGEDLPGSVSATEFVAWYCGHPDSVFPGLPADARSVVVIGVGNVALDCARILARDPAELRGTDVPAHVLRALEESRVADVYIVGRRGPAQAKFTTKELREVGELNGVDVLVEPAELELDPASAEAVAADPLRARNLAVFKEWAARTPAGNPRRVHVRFLLKPEAIIGTDAVEAVRFERTTVDATGAAAGTGEMVDFPAHVVMRSVGYRGLPLADLPFDQAGGVIPNDGGRVLRDGAPVPGEYVAGWIKRGPTGVIGTNKSDAAGTVRNLFADAPGLPAAPARDPGALPELLRSRGVRFVTWTGWEAIERAEAANGQTFGRDRVKLTVWAELLAAAAEEAALAGSAEPSAVSTGSER